MKNQLMAGFVGILLVCGSAAFADPLHSGEARMRSRAKERVLYRCEIVRDTVGDALWSMYSGAPSHTVVDGAGPYDSYSEREALSRCREELRKSKLSGSPRCSCATFASMGLSPDAARIATMRR